MTDLSDRIEEIRAQAVPATKDNMLKVTIDGRKAALDVRLYNENYVFSEESKVCKCAEAVYKDYCEGENENTTQIIFCDFSTPKPKFNMYDELVRLLLEKGVRKEHIAYIQDAKTEEERITLFEKMNKGEIRILIGSTIKLGLGVNVQEKIKSLHHLDIPWRPSDMSQREGRILREGNRNEFVNIYRYIMNGSFDAYLWQLLETKQRFISDFINSSLDVRSESDLRTYLTYAEAKALSVGNPLIKERIEILNEIDRKKMVADRNIEEKIRLGQKVQKLTLKTNENSQWLSEAGKDLILIRNSNDKENKELRENFKKQMERLSASNFQNEEDIKIMDYNGFAIIVPARKSDGKAHILIKGNGQYMIALGDSSNGNLQRLDNFFSGFEKMLDNKHIENNDLNEQKKEAEEILLKKDNTTTILEKLRERLQKIDKELGIKNE